MRARPCILGESNAARARISSDGACRGRELPWHASQGWDIISLAREVKEVVYKDWYSAEYFSRVFTSGLGRRYSGEA